MRRVVTNGMMWRMAKHPSKSAKRQPPRETCTALVHCLTATASEQRLSPLLGPSSPKKETVPPFFPTTTDDRSRSDGASIIGVDTIRRRLRGLQGTCHQQCRSQSQQGVAEEDLGIALPNFAPTALPRCQELRSLHLLPGPASWPLLEINPPGWSWCGHAGPRLPGSPTREEQGRRKEKRLHAEPPGRTCGVPMPGPSTWETWEFQTRLFQGKEVTCHRSRTSAPQPNVKDRATTESPRNPTILLVTLFLYPSVVTMTLYRHSTGGRV